MPRYVTILGIIAAVAGAIGPQVTSLSLFWGTFISAIGLGAAAAGRSLLPKRKSKATRPLLSLALAGVLVASLACGVKISRATLENFQKGGDVAQGIVAGLATLPDQLFDAGAITAEQRDAAKQEIKNLDEDVAAYQAAVKLALEGNEVELRALSPVVQRILQRLRALNAFQSPEMRQKLALIEVAFSAAAVYFAIRIAEARADGIGDRAIARGLGIKYDPQDFADLERLARSAEASGE